MALSILTTTKAPTLRLKEPTPRQSTSPAKPRRSYRHTPRVSRCRRLSDPTHRVKFASFARPKEAVLRRCRGILEARNELREESSSPPAGVDVVEIIRQEAPFVVTRSALTEGKFSYSAPINFEVGDGPAAHIIYMMHLRDFLPKDLTKFKTEVTRVFQPDPNTVLVRWKASWVSEGIDDSIAEVEGSSKYILIDNLIASISENWEFIGERGEGRYANDVFNFCIAHRPLGESRRYAPDAFKLAAWENFKEDPLFGGQLVREEMDELTMQVLYSVLGLGAAMSFLLISIVVNMIR